MQYRPGRPTEQRLHRFKPNRIVSRIRNHTRYSGLRRAFTITAMTFLAIGFSVGCEKRTIRLRVVDAETRAPIPNAKIKHMKPRLVWYIYFPATVPRYYRDYRTDLSGEVVIPKVGKGDQFRIDNPSGTDAHISRAWPKPQVHIPWYHKLDTHHYEERALINEVNADQPEDVIVVPLLNLALGEFHSDQQIFEDKHLEVREHVRLVSDQITDAGLARLQRLASIKVVKLNRTRVTDSGLEHLSTLPSLRVIQIIGKHEMTLEALHRLHAARPNLWITYAPRYYFGQPTDPNWKGVNLKPKGLGDQPGE